MNEDQTQRITINKLYLQQLENEKLLIEMNQRLANMETLPARVRELELQQAKMAWIEKVAYAGLVAGVGALVSGLVTVV